MRVEKLEMYSTRWVDFVRYAGLPNYADCMEKRIDTSKAYRLNADGSLPEGYTPDCKEGMVVERSTVEFDGDEFEAIYFGLYGDVTVWTKKRIWVITQSYANRTVEKFVFWPRDHNELS